MDEKRHYSHEELERYHDSALDAGAGKAVARHLEGCPECSAYLGSLQDLSSLLKENFAVFPDKGFSKAVMRKIGKLEKAEKDMVFPENIISLVLKKKVFLGFAASFLIISAALFWTVDFRSGNLREGDCRVDYVYAPQGNAFVLDSKENIKVVWVFEEGV